jgi:hypothetical protein
MSQYLKPRPARLSDNAGRKEGLKQNEFWYKSIPVVIKTAGKNILWR